MIQEVEAVKTAEVDIRNLMVHNLEHTKRKREAEGDKWDMGVQSRGTMKRNGDAVQEAAV